MWWDEGGEFQMLHKMNPVRVQFVRDKLLEMRREEEDDASINETRVLEDLNVLDVGCGGGLLCESLTRLGANTLGIDASSSNISIASLHASADPILSPSPNGPSTSARKKRGTLQYQHTSVEDLLAQRGPKQFDVRLPNQLRPPRQTGGHLFLSTIARTPLAYLLTIFAAEDVLRMVAPGTHTYSKYINPHELLGFFLKPQSSPIAAVSEAPAQAPARPWIARLYGGHPLRTEAETRGIIYLPWKGEWTLVPRGAPGAATWGEACNYLFWVRRPLE
ncbi:Ubiquinone biosynthesis O-methyltransferase, mitochondrial [Grifola frondosa]|uniref:Ubiquinone biosynthesis O-methyltransferase, mitochondrial n=1 Tax=Grifola frondosa TaxID=5627 RepID=A0A1C7MC19_GRIFR|nr:Ubiquinone biosynthesis O-methyltransferase, mitochondrial [Grifola frondosa]